MDTARRPLPFGTLLRQWRLRRGLSQLGLSHLAEVSSRHLSWLETGRAEPSRAMVLRLAERLELPPRERNGLLAAAGYAPLFSERRADDPSLRHALGLLQRLLDAHDPWPALAVDAQWNLVAHNSMVARLLGLLDPALLAPPVNVLRLTLHRRGLAPMIENLPQWRAHVLQRLQRQCAASGDGSLLRLYSELARAAPAADAETAGVAAVESDAAADIATSLVLRTPHGRLHFITTVTVFGAPRDLSLAEWAMETLLPADEATAQTLRTLHEGASTAA